MIKTVVTPMDNDLHLILPQELIGKRIEVFYYPVDDFEHTEQPKTRLMAKYRGSLKLSPEQYSDFQNFSSQIRDEWDR
ncbi:MAG: hypothetical protein HW421_1645 [Ignavibacteria bacterium]|nr:hypothetical protein [Ignavibacteria bacterium]